MLASSIRTNHMRLNLFKLMKLNVFLVLISFSLFIEKGWASIINQQVKRVVYVNSPVLREEYSIVAALARADSAPIDNYLVIVPPALALVLGIITAIGPTKEQNSRLSVNEVTNQAHIECPPFARCFMVNLPLPLSISAPKVSFGLGMTYSNLYKVNSTSASQVDPIHAHLELSPYFYSPYHTASQKTVLLLVKEFELKDIGCPDPKDLTPTSSPSAIGTIPGSAQFTCGVYSNISPFTEDMGALWMNFLIQRVPFFRIDKLIRTVEYSPNQKTLQVTEEYDIRHVGHSLKDEHFSRIQYMKDISSKGIHGQVIPLIPLSVPKSATSLTVRDEVGLIHSPKPRRKSPVYPELSDVVEVQPRFPLHGGWNLHWKVTYRLPADQYIDRVRLPDGKAVSRLLIPLFEVFHDVAVMELEVNLILPGEARTYGPYPIATNIDNFLSDRKVSQIPNHLHIGHRKVYSVYLKNACKEHHGFIATLFTIHPFAKYRQLILILFGSFITLFIVNKLFKIDLSIEKGNSRVKQVARLANVMKERREMISKSTFSVNKEYNRLEENILEEESQFPRNEKGFAVLKRLYSDQIRKYDRLLKGNLKDSEEQKLKEDIADLDARIINHESQLLADLVKSS